MAIVNRFDYMLARPDHFEKVWNVIWRDIARNSNPFAEIFFVKAVNVKDTLILNFLRLQVRCTLCFCWIVYFDEVDNNKSIRALANLCYVEKHKNMNSIDNIFPFRSFITLITFIFWFVFSFRVFCVFVALAKFTFNKGKFTEKWVKYIAVIPNRGVATHTGAVSWCLGCRLLLQFLNL